MLLIEIAKAAEVTYPNYTCVLNRLIKGYIDLAFSNDEEADLAAKIPLTVNDRFVPTTRTRCANDNNVFISIEGLPCIWK